MWGGGIETKVKKAEEEPCWLLSMLLNAAVTFKHFTFVISLVFTSHAAVKLAHDWGSWSSIWCVVACVESNSSCSLLVACCLSKMSYHHPFFIPHFTVCVPRSQRAETGRYRGLNHATQTRTVNKSLLSSAKVAWRMLINWTGWPCVGQKEPWDTETQQNWHWKQTEKKMKGSNGEKKHGGGGGAEKQICDII